MFLQPTNGHYTGTKHEFRKVQTIDLMAARDIASVLSSKHTKVWKSLWKQRW